MGQDAEGLSTRLDQNSGSPLRARRLELDRHVDDEIPEAEVYVASCDVSRRATITAIEELVNRISAPLVVVVDEDTNASDLKAALQAGAAGLVRTSDLDASLAGTLQAVRGGQIVAPPELMQAVTKPVLSRRQKQVLGLVVMGLSNGEIAAEMHLSEHTVKCHLYASFRKLGV